MLTTAERVGVYMCVNGVCVWKRVGECVFMGVICVCGCICPLLCVFIDGAAQMSIFKGPVPYIFLGIYCFPHVPKIINVYIAMF